MTARTVLGRVREWHDDEGWGVLDSDATPGGCWTHCSAVLVAGYRTLAVGQEVRLEPEVADQDGYAFRAVEAWPAASTPVRDLPQSSGSPDGTGDGAMRSSVRITFDRDDTAS